MLEQLAQNASYTDKDRGYWVRQLADGIVSAARAVGWVPGGVATLKIVARQASTRQPDSAIRVARRVPYWIMQAEQPAETPADPDFPKVPGRSG